MPDRETVITHLKIIHTWAEFARERDLQFFTAKHLEDIAQWTDDALAMLKEQDEFEQKQIFVKEGHSKIVQIICPCCGKKIGCDISVDTEGR